MRSQGNQQKCAIVSFMFVLDSFFLVCFFQLCLTVYLLLLQLQLLHAAASPHLGGKLQRPHLDKSKRFVL